MSSSPGLDEPPWAANRLLAAFDPDDRLALRPAFDRVRLATGQVLSAPGEAVARCHFPLGTAVVTRMVVMPAGGGALADLVGSEGVVEAPPRHPVATTAALAVVRVPGEALRIDACRLADAMARSVPLGDLMDRALEAMLGSLMQASACAKHHSLEQRLAGILLALDARRDPARDASGLPLTQAEMGGMLGVRRTYLGRVATSLRHRGLIGYARGALRLIDRAALETLACPCHRVVFGHLDRLLPVPIPSGPVQSRPS